MLGFVGDAQATTLAWSRGWNSNATVPSLAGSNDPTREPMPSDEIRYDSLPA